jgi:hypothetical protein
MNQISRTVSAARAKLKAASLPEISRKKDLFPAAAGSRTINSIQKDEGKYESNFIQSSYDDCGWFVCHGADSRRLWL